MGNTHPNKKEGCLGFIRRRLFKTKFLKLVSAIRHGNLSLVKHYHAMKVNFSHYMENGDTPLHLAIKYDRNEIARWICYNIQGLNVNDKNFIGDTPLLMATMQGNFDMVKHLILNKNADPNLSENRGYTPFIAACAQGNVEIVRFLCEEAGADIKQRTFDGQSGLHRAAFYGNYDVISYLIKRQRMNVLLPDRKGNLPLHLACVKMNVRCARLLIKADRNEGGKSLYIKNKLGAYPLEILTKQFNKLREPDEKEEFKLREIEEYVKDKHNLPRHKMMPQSVQSPTFSKRSSQRVPGFMERGSIEIKNKFKNLFQRNSHYSSSPEQSGFSHASPEQFPDTGNIIKLNSLLDYNYDASNNNSPTHSPGLPDEMKVIEELDVMSEEQRLTELVTPRTGGDLPKLPVHLPLPEKKFVTPHAKVNSMLMSRLSSIRKDGRSPTSVASNVSFGDASRGSQHPFDLRNTPSPFKRSFSKDSLKSGQSQNAPKEDPKSILPLGFTTKVKSIFASKYKKSEDMDVSQNGEDN